MCYNSKLVNAVISGVNVKRNGRERSWDKVLATGKFRVAHDKSIMIQVRDRDTKKEINFSTFKAGFMVYARETVPYGAKQSGMMDCQIWFNGKKAGEKTVPFTTVDSAFKNMTSDPIAKICRIFNSDQFNWF